MVGIILSIIVGVIIIASLIGGVIYGARIFRDN